MIERNPPDYETRTRVSDHHRLVDTEDVEKGNDIRRKILDPIATLRFARVTVSALGNGNRTHVRRQQFEDRPIRTPRVGRSREKQDDGTRSTSLIR